MLEHISKSVDENQWEVTGELEGYSVIRFL